MVKRSSLFLTRADGNLGWNKESGGKKEAEREKELAGISKNETV